MRYFQIIIAITISTSCAFAQDELDQGEGVVTIYNYRTRDITKSFDTTNLFKAYRYFIKGKSILKKDADIPVGRNEPIKSITPLKNGVAIGSSGSATPVNLTYLINLGKKETYTFYKQDGKLFVAIDSLFRHREEFFYRVSLLTRQQRAIHYLPKSTTPSMIAGKPCFIGLAILNEDTVFFKYTEQPLKVVSPLKYLIPECPYQIMAVNFPADNANGKSGVFHYQVHSIEEKRNNDSLFEIPKGAVIKRNVPLIDILKGNEEMITR